MKERKEENVERKVQKSDSKCKVRRGAVIVKIETPKSRKNREKKTKEDRRCNCAKG